MAVNFNDLKIGDTVYAHDSECLTIRSESEGDIRYSSRHEYEVVGLIKTECQFNEEIRKGVLKSNDEMTPFDVSRYSIMLKPKRNSSLWAIEYFNSETEIFEDRDHFQLSISSENPWPDLEVRIMN